MEGDEGRSNASGSNVGSGAGPGHHRSSSIIGRRSAHGTVVSGKMALKQIDKFMKGLRITPGEQNPLLPQANDVLEDEPIADLFQNTSILFSDIVGTLFGLCMAIKIICFALLIC